MSHHEMNFPSRQELAAMITKPVSPRLKQVSLLLAILGIVIFIVGAATGQDRAWQAWHVNWLFFTVICSAGVGALRRPAHNDGALVAGGDPDFRGQRGVPAGGVRDAAGHDHREGTHLRMGA
jgi:hypothetical protein